MALVAGIFIIKSLTDSLVAIYVFLNYRSYIKGKKF